MLKKRRNESCWCGSGKKYKRCHLSHDEKLTELKLKGYPIPPHSLIKSEKDIQGIKKSCELTKKLLDELNDIVKEGVSTNEINDWVHAETLKAGATPAPLNYKGFPKSICTSINEVICHGIPSDRKLIEGDIINIDITCILNGYYGDSCRMYEIGKITKEAKKLSEETKKCLELGIQAIKPWEEIGVIGDAIEDYATEKGYGVVNVFGGHGIGKAFHEEPFIYHCKRKEKQMIMVPNMIFTVEPMINEGVAAAKILKDGWTAVTKDKKLSAQWEHTVCVTENGAQILT
ncbi:MAG: methionyl aminopeptidase [bacterium]